MLLWVPWPQLAEEAWDSHLLSFGAHVKLPTCHTCCTPKRPMPAHSLDPRFIHGAAKTQLLRFTADRCAAAQRGVCPSSNRPECRQRSIHCVGSLRCVHVLRGWDARHTRVSCAPACFPCKEAFAPGLPCCSSERRSSGRPFISHASIFLPINSTCKLYVLQHFCLAIATTTMLPLSPKKNTGTAPCAAPGTPGKSPLGAASPAAVASGAQGAPRGHDPSGDISPQLEKAATRFVCEACCWRGAEDGALLSNDVAEKVTM